MNPGTTTAPDEEDDPWADDREPEPQWQTGTALDEFLPIYRALARWTDRHGPMGQDQVDRMDISVVAALLGVDVGSGNFAAVAAQWRDEYAAEVAAFEKERETARAAT